MSSFKRLIYPFRHRVVKKITVPIVFMAIGLGYPLGSPAQNGPEPGYTNDQCLECHEKMTEDHGQSVHRDTPCLACHPEAAVEDHEDEELPDVDCRQCHAPHDEKVAHDAHTRVACKACHQKGGIAHADPVSGLVVFSGETVPGQSLSPHQMVARAGDDLCRRCHFEDNDLGAAAMILPAKSILCMPCHAATFSVGDRTTLIALIFFGLGILGAASIWFSGSQPGGGFSGIGRNLFMAIQSIVAVIFSNRILSVVKVLTLDGLLQRRLFRVSGSRWCIHALIFFPFLFRFCWGLMALLASIWLPNWQGAWIMLDKNHPLTAFLFDLSGVLVIMSVVLILVRKYVPGAGDRLNGFPKADWPAYSLMGGIMIAGFLLEAMRIAMTGTPQGSPYAFLGYAFSRLFGGADLTGIYGYMWYVHAIFTGAFLAYLPFSRMFHMIMAPVVLAMNAAAEER